MKKAQTQVFSYAGARVPLVECVRMIQQASILCRDGWLDAMGSSRMARSTNAGCGRLPSASLFNANPASCSFAAVLLVRVFERDAAMRIMQHMQFVQHVPAWVEHPLSGHRDVMLWLEAGANVRTETGAQLLDV